MRNIIYILFFVFSVGFSQQFARPISDITTTGVSSGTFASIDETTANDADYIVTTDNTAATYECLLSPVTDPNVHTGHTLKIKVSKADTGVPPSTDGNEVLVNVHIYQGATLIRTSILNTAVAGWVQYGIPVPEADVANITNYSDLRIRVEFTASGGSPSLRRGGAISWAELEVPDVVVSNRRVFNVN